MLNCQAGHGDISSSSGPESIEVRLGNSSTSSHSDAESPSFWQRGSSFFSLQCMTNPMGCGYEPMTTLVPDKGASEEVRTGNSVVETRRQVEVMKLDESPLWHPLEPLTPEASGAELIPPRRAVPQVPKESSEICATCGRPGHPLCGKSLWITVRANWLRVSETEVAKDPDRFEDAGTLVEAIRAIRFDDDDSASELSDGELAQIGDCLDATERPYPALYRSFPLTQVVHRAVDLWTEREGYL